MQKYQFYPSLSNYESLINLNKTLKAGILVYDKYHKLIYGFSQDNVDANVLKLYTPNDIEKFNTTIMNSIQPNFPNLAAFSKDINALYKIATTNDTKIGMDIIDYRGIDNEYAYRIGVKAFRQTIIDEERICFDVLGFRQKMYSILEELSLLQTSEQYENIMLIPEFEYALSQPASRGIQVVRYNNNVYFIPPTIINNNKSDKVDLICKNNQINKLMNFRIHKSSGIVDVIYRQIIISR